MLGRRNESKFNLKLTKLSSRLSLLSTSKKANQRKANRESSPKNSDSSLNGEPSMSRKFGLRSSGKKKKKNLELENFRLGDSSPSEPTTNKTSESRKHSKLAGLKAKYGKAYQKYKSRKVGKLSERSVEALNKNWETSHSFKMESGNTSRPPVPTPRMRRKSFNQVEVELTSSNNSANSVSESRHNEPKIVQMFPKKENLRALVTQETVVNKESLNFPLKESEVKVENAKFLERYPDSFPSHNHQKQAKELDPSMLVPNVVQMRTLPPHRFHQFQNIRPMFVRPGPVNYQWRPLPFAQNRPPDFRPGGHRMMMVQTMQRFPVRNFSSPGMFHQQRLYRPNFIPQRMSSSPRPLQSNKNEVSREIYEQKRYDVKAKNPPVPWFRWFASRLEKEGKIEKSKNNKRRETGTSSKSCVRCGKILIPSGWLFSSPNVSCATCSLPLCKSCGIWNPKSNSFSCGHCHPPKKSLARRGFWFENLSKSVGDEKPERPREAVVDEVREHIERLVEAQLKEGNLDSTPLSRIYHHPQYDILFQRFHTELSDALMNIEHALKMGIENKPMDETPTSAHVKLTELLVQVAETASDLPCLEHFKADESSVPFLQGKNEMNTADPSYEDVLATTILNKVVITNESKQNNRKKMDSPVSVVDSAVQTDAEMTESEDSSKKIIPRDVRGWVTNVEYSNRNNSQPISDDDLSMGTSSSNWSIGEGPLRAAQVVIEEQVEEITTYESDSDISKTEAKPQKYVRKGKKSNSSHNKKSRSVISQGVGKSEVECLLGTDFNSKASVPFPESGVSIVTRTGEEDEDDEDENDNIVSQIAAWEHNWLFKRRKQLFKKRNLLAEAVPMLVPFPNEDGVEPQIGSDKVSDLSDLSDHFVDEENSEEDEIDFEDVEIELNEIVKGFDVKLKNDANNVSDNKKLVVEESGLGGNVGKVKSKEKIVSKKVGSSEAQRIVSWPENENVSTGKTARFSCTISASSSSYSVAWFFEDRLLTNQKGKIWIHSRGKINYLYLYGVEGKDAGPYHVVLYDERGNETKHSFKLIVSEFDKKKSAPNFTFIKEIVRLGSPNKNVSIPFEISGHPEPKLEVFKNDMDVSMLGQHVYLSDNGYGKWTLTFSARRELEGEYVAVASNSQGTTRFTFRVNGSSPSKEDVNEEFRMNQSESVDSSEGSSIEETLRETSQSMARNQTVLKSPTTLHPEEIEIGEEKEERREFAIAAREKAKWANPVTLQNNPYAPENLEKRMKQRENNMKIAIGKGGSEIKLEDDEDSTALLQRNPRNMKKFVRDYYVNSMESVHPDPTFVPIGEKIPLEASMNGEGKCQSLPLKAMKSEEKKEVLVTSKEEIKKKPQRLNTTMDQTSVSSSSENVNGEGSNGMRKNSFSTESLSDLEEIRLPSVKRLSALFSKSEFEKSEELKKDETKGKEKSGAKPFFQVPKEKNASYLQVHSLTARSVSREFREGLRLSHPNPKVPNQNIKIENEKTTSEPNEIEIENSERNSIMSRAAFWDNRVEKGIVRDELVINEFPPGKPD